MRIEQLHAWDVSPSEAIALQESMRAKVSTENSLPVVRTVAGVDVSIKGERAQAAVVVLDFPGLSPIDYSLAQMPASFPYIPGLLAFREAPVVLAALDKLSTEPDLLIFDAQGLAHPRRMGLATHLGITLDKPSIGCAKSRLCGTHNQPAAEAGHWTPLRDGNEIIEAVVRTRSNVKPVYVSIGHRVDLPTAIEYVLKCCQGYRLPETTRWAHRVAGGEKPPPPVSQPALFSL